VFTYADGDRESKLKKRSLVRSISGIKELAPGVGSATQRSTIREAVPEQTAVKLGNLFAGLKRRNVIRMAGLYLVGAWLVVQIAGTMLPM
jgi:hypothetical protein